MLAFEVSKHVIHAAVFRVHGHGHNVQPHFPIRLSILGEKPIWDWIKSVMQPSKTEKSKRKNPVLIVPMNPHYHSSKPHRRAVYPKEVDVIKERLQLLAWATLAGLGTSGLLGEKVWKMLVSIWLTMWTRCGEILLW